jgi:hypothetical protein
MIVAFIAFSSLFMWILSFYHRSELSYGITKYIKILFINDLDFQILLQTARLCNLLIHTIFEKPLTVLRIKDLQIW